MKKLKFLTIFLLLFIFPAGNLSSKEELRELHNVRWYKVFYSSFNVGDLVIGFDQKDGTHTINVAINSLGLARTATGYVCSATTIAKDAVEAGTHIYRPVSFEATFKLKKKTRHISIRYTDDGRVVGYINNPKEDPRKRPPVPDRLKNGAYDPLTVALIVREKVRKMRDSGELDKKVEKFTLPLFDGRRRSDLNFTIHGRTTQTIQEREMTVIHVSFINVPVYGYTNNEIKNLPEQNPIINVYISDDDLLLPLKGDGVTRIGWATGGLHEECATMQECHGEVSF